MDVVADADVAEDVVVDVVVDVVEDVVVDFNSLSVAKHISKNVIFPIIFYDLSQNLYFTCYKIKGKYSYF